MADEIIGLIGGTGLGDALEQMLGGEHFEEVDTPFGKPSGPVMMGKIGSRKVAFIARHGKGHSLNPTWVPYAANVFALKKLGCRTLIASGAVGSLNEEINPGDLVVVDQFIDRTYRRQSSFFDRMGAVHCEMAEPVCSRLAEKLYEVGIGVEVRTHVDGTYVCMEGPQFSTKAESIMHRHWGCDVVGMTAMPEAKLAREAQMCYSLVALASDYDCWKPHETDKQKQTLLEEIMANLKHATDNCLKLIEAVLRSDRDLHNDQCGCRKSLELAVWTAPDHITAEEKRDLGVLFD